MQRVVLTPGAEYFATGVFLTALMERVHSDTAIPPGRKRFSLMCIEVYRKLAMSCPCTHVCIVWANVDLYFCGCIILPHNEIHTLFFPALGCMYSCRAFVDPCNMCSS